MAIQPKAIQRLNAFSIKPLSQLYTYLKRTIFSFIYKQQQQQKPKTILNNTRTAGGITIPDHILYNKAILIKNQGSGKRIDQLI